MDFHPFPSINQFRHVVGQVRRKAAFMGLDEKGEPILNPAPKYPTLAFLGTVKLHGTNAGIVWARDEAIQFQSRERVLSHDQDNAGFWNYMNERPEAVQMLITMIASAEGMPMPAETVAVYGEWCGGNIQKGVAITGLPKMFVVFAAKVNGQWVELPEDLETPSLVEQGIYSINRFPKYFHNIDFEHPERAQNFLAELTEKIEAECPVGKHFGQTGVGEGIVWRCVEDPTSDLWFKVKGEKHSASKVKTLAAVDVEAVEGMRAFVALTVTEARLKQGLQVLTNEKLKPFDMTSIGDFIRWVHGDVLKEEADTFAATGLKEKNLGGAIAQVAKRWYVEKLNAAVMA